MIFYGANIEKDGILRQAKAPKIYVVHVWLPFASEKYL
jgi:hypothetical protein